MIASVMYCFPRQNNREFDSFLLNFEQLLSDISTRKPTVSIITGGFNARFSSWWSGDINTLEGTNLYSLISSNGVNKWKKHTYNQTVPPAMIYFLLNDQIWQWTLEFMHLYTIIVITKFYTPALILIFLTPHQTSILYGITKRQILRKLEKHLIW